MEFEECVRSNKVWKESENGKSVAYLFESIENLDKCCFRFALWLNVNFNAMYYGLHWYEAYKSWWSNFKFPQNYFESNNHGK